MRLFVGFIEEGRIAVKTNEWAVSCGGVCSATFTVSQPAKHVPRRYRDVLNGAKLDGRACAA
jgi:hypothetical protein